MGGEGVDMREILFKAKRIKDGEWVEGNLFVDDKGEKTEILIGYVNYRIAYEVDKNTICQDTGLKDKNGNKIWDNDVVRNEYERNGFQTLKVYYSKEKAKYVLMNAYKMFTDFDKLLGQLEVIGNIFDNPELVRE